MLVKGEKKERGLLGGFPPLLPPIFGLVYECVCVSLPLSFTDLCSHHLSISLLPPSFSLFFFFSSSLTLALCFFPSVSWPRHHPERPTRHSVTLNRPSLSSWHLESVSTPTLTNALPPPTQMMYNCGLGLGRFEAFRSVFPHCRVSACPVKRSLSSLSLFLYSISTFLSSISRFLFDLSMSFFSSPFDSLSLSFSFSLSLVSFFSVSRYPSSPHFNFPSLARPSCVFPTRFSPSPSSSKLALFSCSSPLRTLSWANILLPLVLSFSFCQSRAGMDIYNAVDRPEELYTIVKKTVRPCYGSLRDVAYQPGVC